MLGDLGAITFTPQTPSIVTEDLEKIGTTSTLEKKEFEELANISSHNTEIEDIRSQKELIIQQQEELSDVINSNYMGLVTTSSKVNILNKKGLLSELSSCIEKGEAGTLNVDLGSSAKGGSGHTFLIAWDKQHGMYYIGDTNSGHYLFKEESDIRNAVSVLLKKYSEYYDCYSIPEKNVKIIIE